VRITVVDTNDGFSALREQWDALQNSSIETSIFLSWEWQFYWWKYYGKQQKLRLLLVTSGDRLVGILPLYIQVVTVFRRIQVSLLRLVGTGGDTSPDYLGPILERGTENEAARLLADFVLTHMQDWDALRLTDMPQDSIFQHALTSLCRERNVRFSRGLSARIAVVPLPESWDAYLASMTKSQRYNAVRYMRKLERNSSVRFFAWSDAENIDAAVDRLIELHHLRWRERNESHAFSSPEYVGFHREVIKACLKRGWLKLYCLEADNVIIAMHYCYRYRNQIFQFQGGFDPAYAQFVPGRVITGYSIQNAIEEGNAVYDFLKGDYEHKDLWTKEKKETQFVVAYRGNLNGHAYRLHFENIPRWKCRVKSLLGKAGLMAGKADGD